MLVGAIKRMVFHFTGPDLSLYLTSCGFEPFRGFMTYILLLNEFCLEMTPIIQFFIIYEVGNVLCVFKSIELLALDVLPCHQLQ